MLNLASSLNFNPHMGVIFREGEKGSSSNFCSGGLYVPDQPNAISRKAFQQTQSRSTLNSIGPLPRQSRNNIVGKSLDLKAMPKLDGEMTSSIAFSQASSRRYNSIRLPAI